MTFHGFAAKNRGEPLTPHAFSPRPLDALDIEVTITHCGICHSDLHLIDNDWKSSVFPLVPGHEIIGTITAIGPGVKHLKVGQRVGIGWQRSSCMECEWCRQGEENLCFEQQATCVGYPGGFADKIRTDSRFAFVIPDALKSEEAAPLLCGGITVFSPLLAHRIDSTKKVGIIGMGGLGHLAVQFAHAMGAEVTVFSHSKDKEADAKKLGADHFYTTERIPHSLDLIICTIAEALDTPSYLSCLRPKGVFCFVGAQTNPIDFPVFSILPARKSVAGSNIGSRHEIEKMLEFAAKHGIKAVVELFPRDKVNEAIEKLRKGEVRYRVVLTSP